MKKIQYIFLLPILVIALSACERLDIGGIFGLTEPHHNERFKQSIEWNKQHSLAEGLEDDCLAHIQSKYDMYQLFWAADLHIDKTTVMLDTLIRMALGIYTIEGHDVYIEDNCTAVIFAGDVIDGKGNFPRVFDALKPLEEAGIPIFNTPGNHDLCFGQWKEYIQYWPTSCYWFDITTPSGKKDLYISCDSGDAAFGKPQLDWLKATLERKSKEGYRHIIFFTHTHLFKRDSNNAHGANFSVEEVYEVSNLLSKYHVEYYINGHDHTHEETKYKNVKYYTIGAMKDSHLGFAAYMTMTVYATTGNDVSPIDVVLHRMSGEEYFGWEDLEALEELEELDQE